MSEQRKLIKISSLYFMAELIILFILRFVFKGFGIKDMAFYLAVSLIAFGVIVFCELKIGDSYNLCTVLIMAFNAVCLHVLGEQMIMEIDNPYLYWPYWFNVIILFSLMLFIYGVSSSGRLAIIITDSLYLILSVLNAVITQFRGRSIDVVDIYSISTALDVSDSYHYEIAPCHVAGTLMIIGLAAFSFFLIGKRKKEKLNNRIIRGIICIVLSSVFFIVVYSTDILERKNYTPAYSSDRNGLLFNLVYELKYMSLSAPEGYSVAAVDCIVADWSTDDSEDDLALYNLPNVIVIMNEAFSDLSVIGELDTNLDVIPEFQNLLGNVIKGYAYSSVYGGNTAVSEYEFLTGDSNMLFNTMPYSTLVKNGTSPKTLVSYMKELGYHCVAMHPYVNSAYRRVPVYQTFGFDEALFMDDLSNLDYLRGFATDSSDYDNIIRLYKEKATGERLFLFNVTMQNHGDYEKEDSEFEDKIELTGFPGKYPQAEQYLSCVHESDKAFTELLSFFAEEIEPTVVVMFGDHQPGIEQEFYDELDKSYEGNIPLDKRKYLIPYVIWANFELPGVEDVEYTSLNFLAEEMKEAAGLPLTGYDKYLNLLRMEYPVISSNVILDAFGNEVNSLSLPDGLLDYKKIMYNHMSDLENCREEFFSLVGK